MSTPLQFSPRLVFCLILVPVPHLSSVSDLWVVGEIGHYVCEYDCVAGSIGLGSVATEELRPGKMKRVSLEVDSSALVGPRDD